uniref:Uncharacterized protein n=1 Tax=Cryptococcus bacillisporus CA1280 TaxID=1296109 RepID=A0A0D0VT55_CRYGA|nr:hypothetical protein I312_02405 [Cryptococcus bacillisporus CA1280]
MDSCVLARMVDHAVWGRILSILSCSSLTDNRENVTTRCYVLGRDLHPEWDMPVLHHVPEKQDDSIIKIPGQDIEFLFSAVHGCLAGGCLEDGERVAFQEREATMKKVAVVRHRDEERFVINTCAFHNVDVLMSALPRELSQPRRLLKDPWTERHDNTPINARMKEASGKKGRQQSGGGRGGNTGTLGRGTVKRKRTTDNNVHIDKEEEDENHHDSDNGVLVEENVDVDSDIEVMIMQEGCVT